ncbi:sterile alpha motif domain-containing protein 11 [Rhinatrema bivittatum]|uniref:sterile alpha motif domain-containing protein 11 n=1 Tax=Rhinatrema bivittatum TaxID=194408 RepID=UPI00112C8C43|nr:sterile alpha motif domain-containing protein 11 [Rhinatrema bivittatum]
MPAVKKERDELALGAFRLPGYLPVVSPQPPAFRPLLPYPEELLLAERFPSVPDFQPFLESGEPCLEVECGDNKALLYIHKLCQGSKGPSIRHRGEWLTPNEFQFVSGRETAKDWKRSIRHKGKSLKTLMSKGILQVHPPICDCPGCRISSPVNRGRLAEKRTVPLPPTRIPKKEPGFIFSHSEDSEEGEKTHGKRPEVRLEEDLHFSIMKRRIRAHWDLNISFRETSCSRDSDLSTIISNLHQSQQLVMPESQSQSCREPRRSSAELGFGAADDFLGKRRVCSPNSTSECPLENKKARSESPKETSQTPLLEDPITQMTPEEHYRRMLSALNEQGTFEEQQRLYQLASSMGVPSHGDVLRARQEAAVAVAVRNPAVMEAHIPASSNSSSQRRKQGLPQHRDASHFSDREMTHPPPPPLLSPQNAPHIALGPHLRPPFLGVPSALCQTPGYGFLQPAQAEMFARQQEMLRKQNLARLEMSAEIIRQKELENLHRHRLLSAEPLTLHPSLPSDHPALRNLHDIPEGRALRDELSRRNAMLVLRHSNAPLLSPSQHGVPAAVPPKEPGAERRRGTRKSTQHRAEPPSNPSETKEPEEPQRREHPMDGTEEEMKDWESDVDASEEKAESSSSASDPKESKDLRACEGNKELSELPSAPSVPCSSPGISKSEVKYVPPGSASLPASQPLPLAFPYSVSPYFHTGTVGGLFLEGEENSALEDISKWTVDDVASFVGSLTGCAEYTQVFRDHAIDGETLPLLSEEHLLSTMGLKLGPALKIRAQVARRLGRVLYMASFPMAFPLRPPDRDSDFCPSPYSSRLSPKQEQGSPSLLPAGSGDPVKPPS